MRQVKKLCPGNTIGIITPAGFDNINSINANIANIQNLGFNVKLGENLFKQNGFLAGTDLERASDLMDMFLDPDIDAIMCYRGGYGTMRILPMLNYRSIALNPKILIGFSDNTTLLNTISKRCDFITFHGPMVNSNFSIEKTLNSFINTLTKPQGPYNIFNSPYNPMKFIGTGGARGCLVGGNLCMICSLLGTPYEIDTSNKILLLEDVGECSYKIDRYLTQLLLCGKLQQASGFIIGQFTDANESYSNIIDVINKRLLPLNKPIIYNVEFGHQTPNITLPIGALAKIDCEKSEFKILQDVVY